MERGHFPRLCLRNHRYEPCPTDAETLADRLNELFSERPRMFDRDRMCAVCKEPLAQPPTGRPRKYCSPACSQAAYRRRRH